MFELDTPRERIGLQRFRIDSEDDINQWTVNAIKLPAGSLGKHGSSCSWQQTREQHEFPGDQSEAKQRSPCVLHDLACSDSEMECLLGEGANQDYEDLPHMWKCDELYGWYLGEAGSRCVHLQSSGSEACENSGTGIEGRVARVSERLERVIIDTGADVSVAPLWEEKHGRLQRRTCAANIRNASRDKMETSCIPCLSLLIQDIHGEHISFQDDFVIASVQQPILAVGKLLRKHWSLQHVGEHGLCLSDPQGNAVAPVAFSKNSLETDASQ